MKKELVKKLFERGVLVTPELLKDLTEERVEEILRSRKLVAGSPNQVSVTETDIREELSVKDFADFYKEKYGIIRDALLQRGTPVSINNIKNSNEVFVIGVVREKTPSGYLIEDLTGEAEILGKGDVETGDVVGVKGHVREGKILESELHYADVPLPKGMKRVNITLVLGRKRVAGEGTQIIFGEASGEGVTRIKRLPVWVDVSGVGLLVFKGKKPKEWLRKRSLPENVRSPKNSFVIGKVPDILWVIGDDNKTENYKGVLIVHTDSKSSAKVNLFSRKVDFV